MDFDRYSRNSFEAIATNPDALRALADRLQDDVLVELHRAVVERFAAVVAELNRRGHKLTDYRDQTPDHGHVRDYTTPDLCALRLAFDLTISAGFEDVYFEGGRGRPSGESPRPQGQE
jgi:hypothetical protein